MDNECLVGTIRNISQRMDARLKVMIKKASLPILLNHIPLFYHLPDDGTPLPFHELQKRWGASKSSVSEIVSRYEAIDFVSRIDSEDDKRCNMIRLRPEGAEIRKTLDRMEETLLDEFLVGFSAEELMMLQMLLKRMG